MSDQVAKPQAARSIGMFLGKELSPLQPIWCLSSPRSWLLKALIILFIIWWSVLLGTKPLVDSVRHFIRDPSGVFSVWHLCECHIVQWRHDSHLLLLLNWFFRSRLFSLHIIKRTLHVGSKIWILCSRGKSNISLVRYCSCHSNIKFIFSRHRVISSISTWTRQFTIIYHLCWLVISPGKDVTHPVVA